ncbi:MAG: multidrug effflux MFS transporter [Alicyclobacillaceae bacterium]|nr:multidrug effflux MFS transporter [Alicyclobacillaceae bacterium]
MNAQLDAQVHTGTEVSPRRAGQWRTAFILGVLTALGPFSIDMYLPSLPQLTADLHSTASAGQLTLTFCMCGLALGQLIAGPLSDARGRRVPLIAGLLAYSVASGVCAMAPAMWVLIVLRFVQGMAGATGIVIARAIARDLYDGPQLTRFYAMMMVVGGAAPMVGPVFGGQVLRFASWHGVFGFLTFAGLAMALMVTFLMPESLPPERRLRGGIRKTVQTMVDLFRDWRFAGLAYTQALTSAGMFAYISASPFVFQDVFGVSPQWYGVIFATNALGFIVAGQVTSRLCIRFGEQRLFTIGVWVSFCASVVLFVTTHMRPYLLAIWIPVFATVTSVGIVGPAGSSLAMQAKGETAGSAAAFLGVLQMFTGALAVPLVGLGGSHAVGPMGVVIAVCEVCAITCCVTLVRRWSVGVPRSRMG